MLKSLDLLRQHLFTPRFLEVDGTAGVTTITFTDAIGAGVSISSGIITDTGSGIVTFYGDARFLQGTTNITMD